ncbi:DNA-directed RNA polymerase subunit beta [Neobacillus thermocopriae]|uniref:DNA-directed RNA polymerase subunit beta n=1 Tax=Neobacillus thermocopriae TaxID=1215031 RepID=UPI002E24E78D|nr:DNA-directed RNA polymerase subunit beta [Neobacillus thermocopriae]MED3713351.1 DNA-directed RNA polymerase subunit beta [Neobacillus thermocopriae]
MSVNHLNQQVQSIEENKDELKQGKDGEVEMAETKESIWPKERIRIRLLPIWLRLVLLVVFTVISLMAGAAVGYGVIGDGKVTDVFKTSTWTHIIDLVNKDDRQKE